MSGIPSADASVLLSPPVSNLRYVLVRNLNIPHFHCRTGGVFAQLNHYYSEVHWGSKEAIWLIGDDTISLPLTVRIYAVDRLASSSTTALGSPAAATAAASMMSLTEPELVDNFLSSTLAHPNRKSDGTSSSSFSASSSSSSSAAYHNTRLVYEAHLNAGLVPLQRVTLHDLTPLPSTDTVLLFASDSGKLFAHRADPSALLRSFLPTALVSLQQHHQQQMAADLPSSSSSSFAQLATYPQMLECCDALISTRAACEQARTDIQSTLEPAMDRPHQVERALTQLRRRKLRQAKRVELLAQIEELKTEVDAMREACGGGGGDDDSKAMDEVEDPSPPPPQPPPSTALRLSTQVLNLRALELLRAALLVYPLRGTCIRDADLLASKEEERSLALGHLAHLVRFISTVFDVPLRFTPVTFGSKSFMMDPLLFSPPYHHQHQQQQQSLARVLGVFEIADNAGGLFPLFPGKVRWKFQSGVQLLFVGLHQIVQDLAWRFAVPITVHKPSTLQSFHNLKLLLASLGFKLLDI